jgi:hypothetical protein
MKSGMRRRAVYTPCIYYLSVAGIRAWWERGFELQDSNAVGYSPESVLCQLEGSTYGQRRRVRVYAPQTEPPSLPVRVSASAQPN